MRWNNLGAVTNSKRISKKWGDCLEHEVIIRVENLDSLKEKVEELETTLKKAKSLADEIASLQLDVIFQKKY